MTPTAWYHLAMLVLLSAVAPAVSTFERNACPRGKPAILMPQPPQPNRRLEEWPLEKGGFRLSINKNNSSNTFLLTTNKMGMTTRQIHTLSLVGTTTPFHTISSFLVRLEGKHNRMDQVLTPHGNNLRAQVSKACSDNHPQVWGLVAHETNNTRSMLRHPIVFDLYFAYPEEGMALDITLADTESGAYYHSQYLIDSVEQRLPRQLTTGPQPRRLNETGETPATPSPSSSPTLSPIQPTTSPSQQPTTAPTTSPSAAPTFAPSSPPSASPTEVPSAEPSSVPSISPSEAPSSVPSTRPSDSHSSGPSSAPSQTPSLRPSATPSLIPTALPSESPSWIPTTLPSFQPSLLQPTTSPTTLAPTKAPTVGTLVTGQIEGRISLNGIKELDAVAQLAFEGAMDGFFSAIYPSTLERRRVRLRRHLQRTEGVVKVNTETTIQSQHPQENANTITYTQTVTYTTFDKSVDLTAVVRDPFDSPELNRQFRDRLKSGNQAFETLANEDIAAPTVTMKSENSNDSDGGFGLGILVGVAVGGAVVVSFLVLIVFRKSFSRKGEHDDPAEPTSRVSVNDMSANDLGGTAQKSNEPDPSVSTMEYDYARAFGGMTAEQSIVSEAVGTMGGDTHESYNDYGTGRSLGSSQFYDESPFVKEEIFEINAPSGKLGVVIDTPDSGPPVVHAVKDSSVLVEQVKVGDKLLKVDGEDVQMMTAVRVSKLISRKSAQASRKLTLCRQIVVEEQQNNGSS